MSISLGCDCAVAHQLRLMGAVDQAFPFDWVKSDNISSIIETLDNNFSNFFKDYTLQKQSTNFVNFDESTNVKSLIKIILKNKIILPHEALNDELDVEKYHQKYLKRVIRFTDVVRNEKIKKIFIRSDVKKISDEIKSKLNKSLNDFGCKNYSIIYIDYNSYPVVGEYEWTRSYIDWNKIIN